MKTLNPREKFKLGVACGLGTAILIALIGMFGMCGVGASTWIRTGGSPGHSLTLSVAASFALAAFLFLGATLLIHRSTRESLRRISEKLDGHASRMAESAFHVSRSVKILSGKMIEETASLFSAQGQLKRISEINERSSLHAVEIQDAAGREGALVTQGFREMQAMIRLLDEAGWASKTMQESMALLDSSTEQLAAITRIADGIALLARNMAVASARQETPSPLAEQVLHLAEQSARAAHEISTGIANATLRSQEAAATAQRVAQSIEPLKGRSLLLQERWTEALTGARDLFRCGSQAVRATAEESAALEQLREEVARVDRELQGHLASSEGAMASARKLNVQAYRLREALKYLAPREEGKTETPGPEAEASANPAPAQQPANPSAIVLWKPGPLAESDTGQPTASRRFKLRFEEREDVDDWDGLDGPDGL